MSALVGLQRWYASQCDGDWEHSYGIKIDTLDNPGWLIEIDLSDTDIAALKFEAVRRGGPADDRDWIYCRVESGKFIATGCVQCLEEMAMVFLKWANQSYETIEDACSVATDVLAGSIDPHTGCALIASIAQKLGYPSSLEPFVAIAHEQYGHEAFGITAESCIDHIVHACRHFLLADSRRA